MSLASKTNTDDFPDSEMYCHKAYATSMVGYGVDIHAPRPPFAALTMFWRSPISLLLKPLWFILVLLIRLFARLFGFLEGFSKGNAGVTGVPQPVSRDSRIPRPAWGPDLSMMDDEFL